MGDPHCTQNYKGSSVNKNILGTRYYAPYTPKEDLHVFTLAYPCCGLLHCARVVPGTPYFTATTRLWQRRGQVEGPETGVGRSGQSLGPV